MCKAYDVAKTIVDEFLTKESFSKDELFRTIREKGGAMRIEPGYTVKRYLEDMEYSGKIRYIPKKRIYQKLDCLNIV